MPVTPQLRRDFRMRRARRAFTLLEVLIATAVTLLMMVGLARMFKDIGQGMKQGRSALQLNNRLRSVADRLRTDLSNITAIPNPASSISAGTGYFKVYDGPQTDYTLATTAANRIGDVDDIIMATVRAGDIWFTGRVPEFILEGRPPVNTDSDGNGRIDDLENLVSIGAQHAEVVFYTQPLVSGGNATLNNPERNPGYLVADQSFFQDNDADGVPDAYRLHYRTLIIRPDLNLNTGILPSDGQIMTAGPQGTQTLPNGTTFTVPSPTCDMSTLHSVCDLSMRRVFNPADSLAGTADFVAANSLQDLVDPANRFAHVQLPIPNTSSTTMPVLALGPALAIHTSVAGTLAGSGFLHPAFTLQGTRVGEDILATDIIGFDVRCYDPGVPLLASNGADGVDQLGLAGSDDLVLNPSDPGYGAALAAGAGGVGSGEYVDLGWAYKLIAHNSTLTLGPGTNVWSSLSGFALSSPAATPFTDSLYQSGQILQTTPISNAPPLVHQMCYDTWSDQYEGDGILQASRAGLIGSVFDAISNTTVGGTVRINGQLELYGSGANELTQALPAWRQANFDAGADGLDNNNAGGADDVSERETSAPFPIRLRGVKVQIRMEDPSTRIVKQMSVAQDFVSK